MSSLLAEYKSSSGTGVWTADEVNRALEAIFSMGEVPRYIYVHEKTIKRLRWAVRQYREKTAYRRRVERLQERKRNVRRVVGRLK